MGFTDFTRTVSIAGDPGSFCPFCPGVPAEKGLNICRQQGSSTESTKLPAGNIADFADASAVIVRDSAAP